MPLYEFECLSCETQSEHVASWQPTTRVPMPCHACGRVTEQLRLISRPARYMGDRPERVMVYGGNYDTTGHRALPELPMPESETREINGETFEVYSEAACRDTFATHEWKEREAAADAIIAEDRVRRERTRAIKAGANIDLRSNPLPGDPHLD